MSTKYLALPAPIVGWSEDLHKTLTSIRRDVKAPLRRLLAGLLDADRDKRFDRCGAVTEKLTPFCVGADLATLADEEKPYQAGPKGRKTSRAVLMILSLMLLVGLVFAWLAWQ